MNALEINSKLNIIESVEDLKFQREKIISLINEEKEDVKKVMTQMLKIVTASNFSNLDETTEDLVYRAIDDVKSFPKEPVIDMGAINLENAIKNRPSSLR